MKLYFAYGSNMDPNRMRKRCPQAVALGRARLESWRLDWSHTSRKNGGSVANIAPRHGGVVWGVVWTLAETFWNKLCAKEGYDPKRNDRFNTYIPKTVEVIIIQPHGEFTGVFAETFVVNEESLMLRPTQRYKRYLIEGAVAHRLPPDYIDELRQIETID